VSLVHTALARAVRRPTQIAAQRRRVVRIKIVLATGLALIAIAVFVVLLHSPATVVATNGIPPRALIASTNADAGLCQAGETLPAGTSAIRLQIVATTGPRVSVDIFEGGRVFTKGTLGPGWFGSVVTVPLPPLRRSLRHATVCFQLSSLSGQVAVYGSQTNRASAATVNGRPLSGRVRIVYLAPARESWWSMAGAVIEHMGLGRAASGTWIVLPIVALAAAAIAVGSSILLRELR
jgi:hypothetical protein